MHSISYSNIERAIVDGIQNVYINVPRNERIYIIYDRDFDSNKDRLVHILNDLYKLKILDQGLATIL